MRVLLFFASGYATFSGCLSTELPPGRDVLYSGYAAIRSRPAKVHVHSNFCAARQEVITVYLCM